MLQMYFFAAPLVKFNGQPLQQLNRSPLLLSLVAYLVMQRERPLARSLVAAAFWPDTPEAQARRTLNSHLYRLRTLLGSDNYLWGERETIQFNPHAPFWLDVLEFESLTAQMAHSNTTPALDTAATQALETAAALYRGDFLEGIYEDWTLPHRERLRERYLLTLNRLVEAYQTQRDFDAAIRAAQQWVHADSFCEAAHYQLIQLYALAGRLNQARAQFEAYQTLWRDELQLEPSAHLRALAEQFQLITPPAFIQNATARLTQLETALAAHSPLPQSAPAARTQRAVELNLQIVQQTKELGLELKKRGTPGKAARYLKRALDALNMLPDSPWRREQEWAIRVACDELYDWDADWNAALENLAAMQSLANKFDAPERQAEARARLAWVKICQSHHREAIALAEQALRISAQNQDGPRASWARRLLGVAYDQLGDFHLALKHYRAALAIDESSGSPEHLPTDLNNVACVLETMSDYDAAQREFERAQNLTLPETPLRIKITLQANLGNLWTKLGQFDAAARDLNQALAWFKRLGERERECWVGACLARLYQRRGELARALFLAQRYYSIARQISSAQRMAELAAVIAAVYIGQQDGFRAREWAEQLYAIAETQNYWRYRVRAAMYLAEAHRLLHQSDNAIQWADRAAKIVRERAQPLEEAAELGAIIARCANAFPRPLPQPQ